MVWKSLQLRFLFYMALGAAVFALLAAGIAYRMGFDRTIASGRATLEGLMVAVERTAAIGTYTADPVLLEEVVDGLSRNPLASVVDIRNADGLILVSKRGTDSTDTGQPDLHNEVVRPLISPFDAREKLGSLHIEPNMRALQAEARREAMVLAALMMAQTVLVALLAYWLAARFVAHPIVRLAQQMRQMQPGTSQPLHASGHHARDEIGALIGSANTLLGANAEALQRERTLRAEVERMEAQYRQIFDASSAGIFVLGPDGGLINCNATVLRMAGLEPAHTEQGKAQDLLALLFARPEEVRQLIADAAWSAGTQAADLELRAKAQESQWVHCLISVRAGESGIGSGIVEGVVYDVTERKHAERAVRHRAEHDGLTDLLNRHASEETLDRFLAAAARDEASVSLLYLDLDGFKLVNDQLGHQAGDLVLKACADRMRQVVRRANDLVGRLGGDEFIVALNHVGANDERLTQIAASLVDALGRPIALDNGQVASVGVSIGVACYPAHGRNREALLLHADAAMYAVKRSGKNGFSMAGSGDNPATFSNLGNE